MFQRALLISFLLLASALMAIYIFFIRLQPIDSVSYRNLVQTSAELRARKALEREPIHQLRQGVQKDIWTFHDKKRLQLRLKSETSHLHLTQKKGKMEAVENLQNIECLIQEAIHPTQQIRRFVAKEGIYHFPSHQFLTDVVDLSFYQIPGTELPLSLEQETPFLTGTAKEAAFSAIHHTPTFNAQMLKLRLDPKREVK
jgi:hypothetical protein